QPPALAVSRPGRGHPPCRRGVRDRAGHVGERLPVDSRRPRLRPDAGAGRPALARPLAHGAGCRAGRQRPPHRLGGGVVAHIPREMQDLPRSGIRALMDLAWAQPGPVLRLEVGQPDRIPPDHIRQAMADSVMAGETKYTPNAGIPELREACAAKLRIVNGIEVEPSQVLVTAGSMQGLSLAILGLTTAGDEILVPDPGWPNYDMAARIACTRPVAYPLDAENGYLPDPATIEPLITDRTRMLIVNSPSNPLGTVIDRSHLEQLCELADRYDLWLLADECYDQIVFEADVAPSVAPLSPDRVVSVHSFSKTYAMTGLRVAYVSGPPQVVETL